VPTSTQDGGVDTISEHRAGVSLATTIPPPAVGAIEPGS